MLPPVVDAAWLRRPPREVVLADVRWYLDGRSGRAAYDARPPPRRGVRRPRRLARRAARRRPGATRCPTPEAFAAGWPGSASATTTPWSPTTTRAACVAARLVWMLRATGHDAALLDGGLAAWDGPARDRDAAAAAGARFTPVPWPADRLASIDERRRPARPSCSTRAQRERYRGETEPVDPRAGPHPGRAQRARAASTSTPTGACCPPRSCGRGSPRPASAARRRSSSLLRLGRDRLPHPARARARRAGPRPAVPGLVVAVEPRPGAAGGDRRGLGPARHDADLDARRAASGRRARGSRAPAAACAQKGQAIASAGAAPPGGERDGRVAGRAGEGPRGRPGPSRPTRRSSCSPPRSPTRSGPTGSGPPRPRCRLTDRSLGRRWRAPHRPLAALRVAADRNSGSGRPVGACVPRPRSSPPHALPPLPPARPAELRQRDLRPRPVHRARRHELRRRQRRLRRDPHRRRRRLRDPPRRRRRPPRSAATRSARRSCARTASASPRSARARSAAPRSAPTRSSPPSWLRARSAPTSCATARSAWPTSRRRRARR